MRHPASLRRYREQRGELQGCCNLSPGSVGFLRWARFNRPAVRPATKLPDSISGAQGPADRLPLQLGRLVHQLGPSTKNYLGRFVQGRQACSELVGDLLGTPTCPFKRPSARLEH